MPGVEVGDDIEDGQGQPTGRRLKEPPMSVGGGRGGSDQKTGRRRHYLVRNVRGERASRCVVYGPTLSRLFEVHLYYVSCLSKTLYVPHVLKSYLFFCIIKS